MIITGVFDGLAVKDRLTAIALYSFEQYKEIHPNVKPEDYRDYLISVQSLGKKLASDGRMRFIIVPFDPESYEGWLEKEEKSNNAVSRGLWALWVAQNQKLLQELRHKHPGCTKIANVQSRMIVNNYLIMAFNAGTGSSVRKLQQPIPENILKEIRDGVVGKLPPVYTYNSISPLQAFGATITTTNRLVDPAMIPEIEKLFSRRANDVGIISVGSRYRPETRTGLKNYVVTVLPIFMIGSAEDVLFWSKACSSLDVAAHIESVMSRWLESEISFLASAVMPYEDISQALDDFGQIILDDIEHHKREAKITRIK